MGTSRFAEVILNSLIDNEYNIISVYTKPDKKVGREQKIQKPEIKLLAEKNNLAVFQPEKLDGETIEEIKKQNPDLIIVAAYGKILPEAVLDIPQFGAINVHPSLLPKFRGPSPIQNALLEGEKETGTTIMLMDKDMDTGDILKQKKIDINLNETYKEFIEKISAESTELLLETIPVWIEKKITPGKQNDSEATYCQLIERSDGKIIWSDSAESIYNRWRALSPWPGVFSFWERNGSNLRLKLEKISYRPGDLLKDSFGEIMRFGDKIAVAAGSGMIILEEVQLEGKAIIKIEDFINGYPEFIGSVLK